MRPDLDSLEKMSQGNDPIILSREAVLELITYIKWLEEALKIEQELHGLFREQVQNNAEVIKGLEEKISGLSMSFKAD